MVIPRLPLWLLPDVDRSSVLLDELELDASFDESSIGSGSDVTPDPSRIDVAGLVMIELETV